MGGLARSMGAAEADGQATKGGRRVGGKRDRGLRRARDGGQGGRAGGSE